MKIKPSALVYLFGLWVLFEYSTRYTALRVYRLVFFGFENWTSIGTVRLIAGQMIAHTPSRKDIYVLLGVLIYKIKI